MRYSSNCGSRIARSNYETFLIAGLSGGVLDLRRRLPHELPPAEAHREDQERRQVAVLQLSDARATGHQRHSAQLRQRRHDQQNERYVVTRLGTQYLVIIVKNNVD